MRFPVAASIQFRGVCMRLTPIGTQIAAQTIVMMIGLALSLPVFAALSVDAQHLFVGSADDEVLDAVADSAGNLYVTGWTSSSSIDGQAVTIQGSRDAFVAKLDSAGNLVAVRVFGGAGSSVGSSSADGNEQGTAIAMGPQGNVFVTGALLGDLSNGIGLPTTVIDQTCRTTLTDAFILVLQPDLTPSYFTCFGDLNVVTRGQDISHAIAVDGQGDAFIGGTSAATAQKDGFVLKLKNPLTSGLSIGNGGILYSKLISGSFNDEVLGLTIDGAGQAYATGGTISADFPTTVSAIGPINVDAATDAFVARISADGSQISLSVLIGGDGTDQGNAIALDANTGDIYVTGETTSTDLGGAPPGGRDAFVARILSDGSPSYVSYIGTTGNDRGLGVVFDQDAAVVTGVAGSSGLGSVLADFTYQGGDDGFVVRLNANGSIAETAYLGGTTADQANTIRLNSSGGFIVSGHTATTGAAQDGFVITMTHTTPTTGGGNTGGTGNSGNGGGIPIQIFDPTPSPAPTGASGGGGGGGGLFWPVLLTLCLRPCLLWREWRLGSGDRDAPSWRRRPAGPAGIPWRISLGFITRMVQLRSKGSLE